MSGWISLSLMFWFPGTHLWRLPEILLCLFYFCSITGLSLTFRIDIPRPFTSMFDEARYHVRFDCRITRSPVSPFEPRV